MYSVTKVFHRVKYICRIIISDYYKCESELCSFYAVYTQPYVNPHVRMESAQVQECANAILGQWEADVRWLRVIPETAALRSPLLPQSLAF